MAEKEGKDPFDALFDLLAREHCAVTMIDEIACEDDLEAILRDGHSSIISDSIYPGSGLCHPRVYGTFVRAIERYVRERGVLTLEEAGLPQRMEQWVREGGTWIVGPLSDERNRDGASVTVTYKGASYDMYDDEYFGDVTIRSRVTIPQIVHCALD